MEFRRMLYRSLLRSSIAKGDYKWEGALLSSYHIASRVLAEAVTGTSSMGDYVEHREQFHRTLFSACDNQWLLWAISAERRAGNEWVSTCRFRWSRFP